MLAKEQTGEDMAADSVPAEEQTSEITAVVEG